MTAGYCVSDQLLHQEGDKHNYHRPILVEYLPWSPKCVGGKVGGADLLSRW